MATSLYKAQSAVPTCSRHDKEPLDMFCRDCGMRVCEKCAKTFHKDHDWTTANKGANEARRNTASTIAQIRQIILEMKGASTKLHTQEDVQRVRKQEKILKALIGKQADELVKNLENGASNENLSKKISAMEKLLEFFNDGISFAHDNVIVEMEEEFRGMMTQSKSLITRSRGRRVRYMEGSVVPETLRFMLGEVREETDGSTEDQSTASVTEISSFTHGTEFIQCIQLLSESEAWIHSDEPTKNDRVNSEGKKISERMIGKDFDDFTVIDNDHVYTDFGNKMIRRVSSSGVISDVTSTAPLGPAGICTARAGGLLVSLCSDDVPQINKDSYGEVHHLDMNGKLLRKYPDHGDGHTKLFTFPLRIVQNMNLDLCVVDTIATDDTTRLVVVAVDGEMRFHYKGQNSLKERFICQDVTCDTQGRIILSDYHNNAVHLLTADGEFIQLLLTEQRGLRGPISLAVRGDKLWVGCTKGVIKVYQYNV